MYESHFGFSGPPFQLNPDPSFLFESSNHGRALSYLRYGVHQCEGFIVITGDIGAGKTTLVRVLLEQLDADQVVAAHLANTQLESAELLHCILTAFGVPAQGLGKGGMIANLEAFLTGVAASGRRALLVVDEAQNLSVQALEELRMLSNFQLGSHALLQSFLVGQPELRQLLQGPTMEQLRQRILASYHLGPLSAEETAGYVKHRLQHVGWRGNPPFDDFALGALHERTGGVPRRINLLCNRVLLATYLAGSEGITHEMVHQTADELSGELDLPRATLPVAAHSDLAPDMPPSPAPADLADGADAQPVSFAASAMPLLETLSLDLDWAADDAAAVLSAAGATGPEVALSSDAVDAEPAAQPHVANTPEPLMLTSPELASVRRPVAARAWPCVLGLVDSGLSLAKMHRVALRWRQEQPHREFLCAYLGNPDSLRSEQADPWLLNGAIAPDLFLGDLAPSEVAAAMAPWLNPGHTQSLVVIGHSWELLHAVLAARQAGIPVLRLEAGALRGDTESDLTLVNALMDRSGQWLCCAGLSEQQALAAEGLAGHRVARVGQLVSGVLHTVAQSVPDVERVLSGFVLPPDWLARASNGFGLITAQFGPDDVTQLDALQWLMLARLGHAELPMLWLANSETLAALREPSLRLQIESAGIAVVADPGPLSRLSLLGAALCVMCSSARTLMDEALTIGVPVVCVGLYAQVPSLLEAGGVTQVGPSAVHLRSAVRAAHRRRGSAAKLTDLDDDAAIEVAQKLARWMALRADGAAAFEEAVA